MAGLAGRARAPAAGGPASTVLPARRRPRSRAHPSHERPGAGAPRVSNRRNVLALIGSNLFGGVGVASSVAVGGLLVEQLASTEAAGFAQAVSILGAGLAAVPLAALAQRRGRRVALALGYVVPILGAALVVVAALTEHVVGVFAGLALFGV